jgi:hypothetical protein
MGADITKHQSKPTFSGIVKQAVDNLWIRDYYKWVDDRKLAIHVNHVIHQLLSNFSATKNDESWGYTYTNVHRDETQVTIVETKALVVKPSVAFLELGSVLQGNEWINWLNANSMDIMEASPGISTNDRLLWDTVMKKIAKNYFDIENDVVISKDVITEMITTTRVPDWDEVRYYIEKQWDKSVWFADQWKASWKIGVEELFRSDLSHIPWDFGIDEKYRKMKLSRLMKNGINMLSHTPFEYFHECTEITTNKKDQPIYMLRIYTHYDTTTEKSASIVCFLDKDFNLLCPDFPVIDDPQSKEFFANNIWQHYNIWRYARWLFFKYKNQLFAIQKWKYIQPSIANQLSQEEFYRLEKPEKWWWFIVATKGNRYLTDSYLKTLKQL